MKRGPYTKHPPPILETDVPPPPPGKVKRKQDVGWEELKPGQSYLFKNRNIQHIHSLVVKARKRTGFKFTVRPVGIGDVRVWRLRDDDSPAQ